jgi:hypothetical protein
MMSRKAVEFEHFRPSHNGFFSRTAYRCQQTQGLGPAEWWSECRCAAEWEGTVRPDGLGRLGGPGIDVRFFLELDRGTERISPLEEKLARYERLARFPDAPHAVLFLFPTERREAEARRVLFHCGMAVLTGTRALAGNDPRALLAPLRLRPAPPDQGPSPRRDARVSEAGTAALIAAGASVAGSVLAFIVGMRSLRRSMSSPDGVPIGRYMETRLDGFERRLERMEYSFTEVRESLAYQCGRAAASLGTRSNRGRRRMSRQPYARPVTPDVCVPPPQRGKTEE